MWWNYAFFYILTNQFPEWVLSSQKGQHMLHSIKKFTNHFSFSADVYGVLWTPKINVNLFIIKNKEMRLSSKKKKSGKCESMFCIHYLV